jgi:hypothetical protein
MNDYRRVDVWAFLKYLLIIPKQKKLRFYLKISKELALGLEIFNLFNNQNAITNTRGFRMYSKINMQYQTTWPHEF